MECRCAEGGRQLEPEAGWCRQADKGRHSQRLETEIPVVQWGIMNSRLGLGARGDGSRGDGW